MRIKMKEEKMKKGLESIYVHTGMSVIQKMEAAESFMCEFIEGFGFESNNSACNTMSEFRKYEQNFDANWADRKLKEYLTSCSFEYFSRSEVARSVIFDGKNNAFVKHGEAAFHACDNMKATFLDLDRGGLS